MLPPRVRRAASAAGGLPTRRLCRALLRILLLQLEVAARLVLLPDGLRGLAAVEAGLVELLDDVLARGPAEGLALAEDLRDLLEVAQARLVERHGRSVEGQGKARAKVRGVSAAHLGLALKTQDGDAKVLALGLADTVAEEAHELLERGRGEGESGEMRGRGEAEARERRRRSAGHRTCSSLEMSVRYVARLA